MSVVTGQVVTTLFTTHNATTGAAENAAVLPVGTLYLNGVATADPVTVANIAVGVYRATATMPALVAGDDVAIRISATVALIADEGRVWEDCRDGYIDNLDAAISTRGTADPGDAMALTGAERTTLAMVIWNVLTTALTTVGSIGKYIVDKLGLIGSGAVFVTSPVADSGNVTVVRGDSYLNADGRRLEWTNTSWNIAAGSTIAVIVQDVEMFTGTRLSATQIGLELTSAQTGALTVGENYLFSVQEVKVGGERISRVQGKWKTTLAPTPTS